MDQFVLKRQRTFGIIAIIGLCCVVLTYCKQTVKNEGDINRHSDSMGSGKNDSALLNEQTINDTVNLNHAADKTNGRSINAADKQQIDWLIPEDAEIVIFEESEPETRRFAQALYNHILTRSPFGIERKKVSRIAVDTTPTQKFYINFIGDHRYEVRVFNKYKH